jgi:hypothetical protein
MIDGKTVNRSGGLELEVIVGRQFFEFGGVFAGDHERLRLNSGFESVEPGSGLPLL